MFVACFVSHVELGRTERGNNNMLDKWRTVEKFLAAVVSTVARPNIHGWVFFFIIAYDRRLAFNKQENSP